MTSNRKFALAIHGGAGPLPYWGMTPQKEEEFRKALSTALDVGYRVLSKGGSALDAVEKVLVVIEDEPLFNAGVGSAINRNGEIEMDACIMCGMSLKAGSVACIRNFRNPIKIARQLLDKGEHLFLSGSGAEEFAAELGLPRVQNDFFKTAERMAWWQDEVGKKPVFKDDAGTAGTVALDLHGNLASATSTGGLMMKRRGRIGDTPLIGAGTYANNETCAVSCSGTG
jgi:L-asparaginase / beta-aspartyl-peptidase